MEFFCKYSGTREKLKLQVASHPDLLTQGNHGK